MTTLTDQQYVAYALDMRKAIPVKDAADYSVQHIISELSHRLLERGEELAVADGFEQRTARLRHVGMELTGVIDEYRAMPCDSLKVRMFQTADRYRKRLTAKCGNCEDHGVVGYPDTMSCTSKLYKEAEAKTCCTITAEDRALLAAGDYTPEELFGVGGKPSCPKCFKPAEGGGDEA